MLVVCIFITVAYGFTPIEPTVDPIDELPFDYYHAELVLQDPTLVHFDTWDITKSPDTSLEPDNILSTIDDFPEKVFDIGWDFEFYGHKTNWMAVSPNGFITTHPITFTSFANWWSENNENYYRRYIAPLMTDLDPSNSTNANIYIQSTDTHFAVQWKNVGLYNPYPNEGQSLNDPRYTFQVTLERNTNIIWFIFLNIDALPSDYHVKSGNYTQNFIEHVGCEDAMYDYDHTSMSYETIPYKPVSINKDWVKTGSMIKLTPKPTCLDYNSCGECTNINKGSPSILCEWHSELNLCINSNEISRINGLIYTEKKIISINECSMNNPYDLPSTRKCFIEQRVLIKEPQNNRYVSGVISSLDTQSIGVVKDYKYFNAPSDANEFELYTHVYLCAQVSWDYNPLTLPNECMLSCATGLNNDNGNNNRNTIRDSIKIFLIILLIIFLVGLLIWLGYWCYKSKKLKQTKILESVPDNEIYDDDFSEQSKANSLGIMVSPELQIHSDGSESLAQSIKKPSEMAKHKVPETIEEPDQASIELEINEIN